MFITTAVSEPLQPASRSEHIGIACSRGGAVTIGEYFTIDKNNPLPPDRNSFPLEVSKFLTVTGAGALVFKYYDGNYDRIDAAVPGFYYPINAVLVVDSFTFANGGLITTTATGIHWWGGV